MRKLRFFLPFAALGLLASCSNDNMGEPTPQPDDTPIEGTYVSFNIATPSTRASYEEGYLAESNIKNVWLYLYRLAKTETTKGEDDAVLYAVKQLAISEIDDPHTSANSEVGSVISATFQLTGMTETDKTDYNYYALIVVNQGNFNVPKTDGIGTDTFSDWKDQTWKATQPGHVVGTRATSSANDVTFNGSTTNNPMVPYIDGKYYFTMTNAPLINDGKSAISVLAVVDTDKFETSPKKAQEAAASVFVQRGVAKVEVSATAKSDVYINDTETDGKAKVTATGWALDVINTNTYALQHVADVADFADGKAWGHDYFLGPLTNHDFDGSHIFWSMDPEYNQTPQDGTYLSAGGFNGMYDAEYCLENTMTAKMMQKNQTTRVVFQAQYLVDGESAKDFILYNDIAYVIDGKAQMTSGESTTKKDAGPYAIKDIVKDEETNIADAVKALGALNSDEIVQYYPNGTTYYTAAIRHFVGTNEPGANKELDNKVSDLDTYKEETDLGRYGVVRNNTYKVKVNKFFGFGSPTVPPTTPEPNDQPDPKKYNVQLDIEVLNWAVREYGYTAK